MTSRNLPEERAAFPYLLGVAFLGFGLIFTGLRVDFWWQMAATSGLLAGMTLILDSWIRDKVVSVDGGVRGRDVAIGIGAAVILYGIFWIGNLFSRSIFDFAPSGIGEVYALKGNVPIFRIGLLLALVIGPSEEIFWRGFVLKEATLRYGRWGSFWAVILYGGVHLPSMNIMLVLAAGVCGLFWVWLYNRYQRIWINIVSHVIWDLAVFLFFPFQ